MNRVAGGGGGEDVESRFDVDLEAKADAEAPERHSTRVVSNGMDSQVMKVRSKRQDQDQHRREDFPVLVVDEFTNVYEQTE